MSDLAIQLPHVPATASIDGRWIADRDALLEKSREFCTIANNETYQAATDALARITKHSNALEAHRKALAAPFNDAATYIKSAADNARKSLEDEKARLKQLLGSYADAERKRVEAEQREAERKRREAIEAQIAAQADADDLGLPAAPIAEPAAPPVIAPVATSSAARVVERVEWEITDIDKVPRAFCMIDERLVNAYRRENADEIKRRVKAGAASDLIPGIKFTIKTDVAAR